MPLIDGLHHVSLIVADTERALGFYRDLLGLGVDASRPDLGYPGAWLWASPPASGAPLSGPAPTPGGLQIHLLELPNPDPVQGRPAHGGRDRHVALAVTDLDRLRQALDAAGIPYTQSRSGRRALFCRDPDANALEFVELSG